MIIYVIGPTGSGKSTVVEFFAKKGFFPIQIDSFYLQSPRDSKIKEWFEDKIYVNHARSLFKAEIKNNKTKNIILENTGKDQLYADIFLELAKENEIITLLINIEEDTLRERIRKRNSTDYPFKQNPDKDFSYKPHSSIIINYHLDNNSSKEHLLQQIRKLQLL